MRKDEPGHAGIGGCSSGSCQLSAISFQMRCNACGVFSAIRSGGCSHYIVYHTSYIVHILAALQAFHFNSEALIETLK